MSAVECVPTADRLAVQADRELVNLEVKTHVVLLGDSTLDNERRPKGSGRALGGGKRLDEEAESMAVLWGRMPMQTAGE